jgi:hypothetical protein
VQSPSDSSSDSWEEELLPVDISEAERLAYQEIADAHKLRKMTQAVLKRVPITIEIGASYVYGDVTHQAVFSKEVKITHSPQHVLELLQLSYKQIEQIGLNFRLHWFGQIQGFRERTLKLGYSKSDRASMFAIPMRKMGH